MEKKKNHLSSQQWTNPQKCFANGKIERSVLSITKSSTLFPALASSDFHLFPKLKYFLTGEQFSSNEEVVAAVPEYFVDVSEIHYSNGIIAGTSVLVLGVIILKNKNHFEIINFLLSLLGSEFFKPPSYIKFSLLKCTFDQIVIN